ncbi:MAG TPA: tetratricopeptide repeat protein [Draconibacterium sp.]|nr:tetratricopeptide repeat protein [Draconibacterium sp.]
MKKTIRYFSVVVLFIAVVSCSGGKKITEQQVVNAAVETPNKELAEKKQMEFDYLFSEALKQKMFGNAQNAIQILSSCLEIDPNSSAAMYELASIHAANNDFTSATLLLEKAISLNPDNIWYKQMLAQIYQQTKRFDDAARLFTELLKKDPENQQYLYSKAIMLANAEKYNQAIDTYKLLEQKTGINEQISVEIQQLYLANGQVDKAFAEIEKLIKDNPTEPKYYGLLADLYQSQGDSLNALKNYNKILEMDPESGFVHFSLANYYLENNQSEKSFEETKKGFASKNVELQTKIQLYMMLVSNREESKLTDEKEVELINILLENHPDEFLVYTIQADNLLRNNKLAEGRAALLKALELETNDYMIWERVLFIDNDLQDWPGLYEHSTKAIELFPNQPNVYLLKSVACIQLEKYDETIAIIDEGMDFVVDNAPLKGQLLMLKGEALYKQNKIDEAFKLFDKSVELNPENYVGLNNYAYYLSLVGRDLDKAERMSGKVIERFPDNATYLDTYAWVLFKKGNYTLAKFYMEAAIKNSGEDNAVMLEHYGDILFMLNKLEEANQYWEKAKNSGSKSEVLLRKIREQKYFEE